MNNKDEKRYGGVAAVLSFVFTGVGQIYNGDIKKGLFLVFMATVGVALTLLAGGVIAVNIYYGNFSSKLFFSSIAVFLGGGIIVCWSGIYSIVDAYKQGCLQQ